MDQSTLNEPPTSPYFGSRILLTTKHQKARALFASFEKDLKAAILEYVVGTDQLGSFSGEVDRKGSALIVN